VRLRVDVIVTHATANVVAAKQGTSVIPIVFAAQADPVGTGLVASLARPGGNITVPGLRRLAILANGGIANTALEIDEAKTAARALGIEVATFDVRRAEDIAPAFDALKGRSEGV
jgi:putative ABC transport system substrate-binding protein